MRQKTANTKLHRVAQLLSGELLADPADRRPARTETTESESPASRSVNQLLGNAFGERGDRCAVRPTNYLAAEFSRFARQLVHFALGPRIQLVEPDSAVHPLYGMPTAPLTSSRLRK